MQATKTINVGDEVRYFKVGEGRYGQGGRGWMFGEVIGLHIANQGVNPSGLEMATVRFPSGDRALPVFQLEAL